MSHAWHQEADLVFSALLPRRSSGHWLDERQKGMSLKKKSVLSDHPCVKSCFTTYEAACSLLRCFSYGVLEL